MEHIIDAKHKKLGRLASQIASILQGKHTPAYNPRLPGDARVVVKNVRGLDIASKKAEQKVYYRHTGPLGHLKERRLRDVLAKKPAWALRNAVRLMLPKNRLQAVRLRRLTIEE